MTITTDEGLRWAEQRFIGTAPGTIDAMAVGSGSAPEEESDLSLNTRESDIITSDNSPVRFIESDNGRIECIITIQGGSEVPTDTEIREVGVYASAKNGNPRLIARDVFSTVTVNPGHSVEFTIPLDVRR